MASYNQQNTGRFSKDLGALIAIAEKVEPKDDPPQMNGGTYNKESSKCSHHEDEITMYKPQTTTMKGGNPNVDIVLDNVQVEPVKRKITRRSTLSEGHNKTVLNLLKDLFA